MNTKIDVIVPHDRAVNMLTINSMPATRMVTHTPTGVGYDIETWEAPANGPGEIVMIQYRPR